MAFKKIHAEKVPKEKPRKAPLREKIFPLACLTPSFIGVMIFFLVPFAVIIFYAMVDNPINKDFVFLDNFISVFKNNAFRKAAMNTLKFSAVAVPLAVVLGLWLAMLLDSRIPGVSWFRTGMLCPMMVPVASVVLIWQVIFHYNGTLTYEAWRRQDRLA